MICINCGTENAAGRRFCDECGSVLAAACPSCGETNRPAAKFCGNCGSALSTDTPAIQTTTTPTLPSAERRFVTVLFADLVGFTPFAEERDAEKVRETLDRYFGVARLAVERHGGTIEKFIGDAVMAVWGTPTAHEDDAERAVRAAFELLEGVRDLGHGIDARAAVTTGEAAVNLGAEGQGMVAGDLVNTASRLQQVAAAGAVLVNEATVHAAQAAIAFESVGAQELKGKQSPVPAWRALRVVAQRGGHNRSDVLEAPFVGRDDELRELKELMHATTRDQRVRLVSITGPPGIGKSRLAWELEKYVDGVVETVYWHRGRSPSYGEGITFWALGEMVRRRAHLAETDDETTTRAGIAATVEEFMTDAEERAWVEPALLTLLGLQPAPPGGRDALFAAWRIFFERIAQRATTVLVFEDLHWADSGLLDFIEHLLEWSRNRALLVIALARPELYEQRPGWGSGHRLSTSLSLEPLAEDAMRSLLEGLAPGLPAEAVQTILDRADGIPLYAVETVRMLVADGRLEHVGDMYLPTGELRDLAVPETLRSLIASRLDGLDPSERSLLQDAAVLGQRFTLSALAAVSGQPDNEIEPRLRHLVRREFLDLESDPRSPERGQYGFVQSLIREVAYGTLGRRERRARHLAAARHFEALGEEELAGALATHYLAALRASAEGPEADAVAVQARLALRGAAQRAASLGAHGQAVSHLEQALDITSDARERASLLELAAASANASGQEELADRYAREAIAIHIAGDDEAAAARTSALLGRILIDVGRMADAAEALDGAIQRAEAGHLEEEKAALMANLSRVYMRTDAKPRAIEAADRALAIAEPRNLEDVVVEAFLNKGSSLHSLGRRREGAILLESAVRLAANGGWVDVELRARNNLSVAIIGDDGRRALDIVLGGIELARRVGQRGMFNWLVGTAAMYRSTIGDGWDESLELLEETLSAESPVVDRARALAIRAFLLVQRVERPDEALAEAEAARKSVAERQIDATLHLARAKVGVLEGAFDDAYLAGLRAADAWPDFIPFGLSRAVIAALLAGRIDDARTVARRLHERPGGSQSDEAGRMHVAAAIDAATGRTAEAFTGLRAAAAAYRGPGLDFLAAEVKLDALRLLPGRADVREWAADAREIFERVGARPYLSVLDASLDAAERRAVDARGDMAKAGSAG